MIVGFNFNKINVEKNGLVKGKINVSPPRIDIKGIKEQVLPLKDKNKVLDLNFEFSVRYEPNIGSVNLSGDVLYMDSEKKISDVLNIWNKHKKLPEDASLEIVNFVLIRCNVKALELSDELNLPPHIPMKRVEMNKTDFSSYIG